MVLLFPQDVEKNSGMISSQVYQMVIKRQVKYVQHGENLAFSRLIERDFFLRLPPLTCHMADLFA